MPITTNPNSYEKIPLRIIKAVDYQATFNVCYKTACAMFKADLAAIADLLGLCPTHRRLLTNYDLLRLYGDIKIKAGKRW